MAKREVNIGGAKRDAGNSDANFRLNALAEILVPMAEALGSSCEIILHDYRQPEHSVVSAAGSITHRKVGSAMSEIGLSVLAEGNQAQHRINYMATTSSGRIIKSSTIVLRDTNHKVFGALCINTDVTALHRAAKAIANLIGAQPQPQPTTFTDDIRVVIDTTLAEQLDGRHPESLSMGDRLAIFRALDKRGVFGIKRSLSQVAGCLGISRATAYTYLQKIRTD